MNRSLLIKSIVLVSVCLAIGYISGITTSQAMDGWYSTLNKPSFNPPSSLFAPMWVSLYVLMGVAAAIVWDEGLHIVEVKSALFLFGFQLILNILWTQFFFGMQSPILAMGDIVLLFITIWLCVTRFWDVQQIAGLLMVPYLLWVGFAAVLNGYIIYLN
ncbi:MAG: tryptophan-rich sensory protein [Balneolaceae bacterium]|nr:tryptophan-rich sensory protein [Balneolaceae bacterium]